MNINATAGFKLAAITAFMLSTSLGMAPLAQAKKDKADDANWSDWSAIGAGYVARRREPPKMDLPPSERRLAGTQVHSNSKKSKAEKKTRDKQPKSADATAPVAASFTAQATDPAATTFTKLWFYTTEEGLHSVSIAELASQSGKTEKSLRRKAGQGKLTLTNGGEAVAWHFDEQSDSIWFAANTYDSFHTDADAYHFVLNAKSALPMAPSDYATPVSPGTDSPFVDTLHFEEEPDFQFSSRRGGGRARRGLLVLGLPVRRVQGQD